MIALAILVGAAVGTAYLRAAIPRQAASVTPFTTGPLQATASFVTFDFLTPSLGWAALSLAAPSSTRGQFAVFHTVDGAKHWRLQLLGESTFSGIVPLSVQIFDLANGFMVVGGQDQQLFRTSDRGSNWVSVNLPPTSRIDTIAFGDRTHGWLLASTTATPDVLNLYSSSDGGTSWHQLPDPPADARNLRLRSATELWLGSVGTRSPRIYASTDAGRSWQPHDLPAPSGLSWDGIGGPFEASGELVPDAGFVVSALCTCTSGPYRFMSIDGGTSWRYVHAPQGNVAYQSAVEWWSSSGKVLVKSHDAGQTWVQITDKLPDPQFGLHVLDARHAWALVNIFDAFGLAFTTDGGLRWARATVPQLPLKTR